MEMLSLSEKGKIKKFYDIVKENPHNYRMIKTIINDLREEDVDMSYQVEDGSTLLHLAIKLKDIKLLKLFLDNNVNVNLADYNRIAPIHLAIKNNRLDMLKLLIEYGADIELTMELEQTPLHQAICLDEVEIVKYLVKKGANIHMVDENNNSILDYAIDQRNIDIIRFLLDYGIDKEHRVVMNEIIKGNK